MGDVMKERPILMSGPMVTAILSGAKTQTRRVVKFTESGYVKEPCGHRRWHRDDPNATLACPYGSIGDRLWVRETFQPLWADENQFNDERDYKTGLGYYVNYPATDGIAEWHDFYREEVSNACKPSIFMPRWASRITLEITDVRVERLMEISADDVIAEGVGLAFSKFKTFSVKTDRQAWECGTLQMFAQLWDKINGKKHSWASNPFVWVVEFKRV